MFNIREHALKIKKLIEFYEKEQQRNKKIQILNLIYKEITQIELHLNQNYGTTHNYQASKLKKELKIIEHKEIPEHKKEYQISIFGKIANLFFSKLSEFILETFTTFNKKTTNLIRGSGLRMLTNTYLSTALFSTFLLLFIGAAIGTILFYQTSFLIGLIFGPILSIITIITFISYPVIRYNNRKTELNEEYPFIVNYLSALSNSKIKDLALFEILLNSHQKTLIPELKKIILYSKVFNHHLDEAIILGTQNLPSEKMRNFFKKFSEIYKNNQDQRLFLNKKAHECIIEYESLNKSPYKTLKTLFHETGNILTQIKFNLTTILPVIIGLIIIFLTYTYTNVESGLFPLFILIAFLIIWIPIFMNVYKTWNLNLNKESHFLNFVKDLNNSKNLLTLNKDYGPIDKNVKKLIHQYKLAIPLEKAIETFAKETNNILIESSIILALEAKKHDADLYEALENITKSKVLKNILRIERI